MDEPKVKIIKGKILPAETIRKICKIWKKEFKGDKPLVVSDRPNFAKDTFFIVYNQKNRILSVGRLRPIEITFLNKKYKIQGIADIASVIKAKGYGKILMLSMRKYLRDKGLTGVGFCSNKNSLFYQKCGFKIAKDSVQRFLYKNPEGKLIKDEGDDDVLYLNGKNRFMEQILAHPKEKIFIPCPHW